MTEQTKVFLTKVSEKIRNGEFDKELSLFVSRDLIYSAIKARINKKIETGSTPLLSDNEITESINDAKEVAASTLAIFLKLGIVKIIEGTYKIDDKWKSFLKLN